VSDLPIVAPKAKRSPDGNWDALTEGGKLLVAKIGAHAPIIKLTIDDITKRIVTRRGGAKPGSVNLKLNRAKVGVGSNGQLIVVRRHSAANKNIRTPSDWYLENGNYLRLKNLLIGYTFRKIPWDGTLRLYFSGDNLLTFTKYTGMDPEVGGYGLDGGQYPVSRVFSFGAKLNF